MATPRPPDTPRGRPVILPWMWLVLGAVAVVLVVALVVALL
jgi:hypothetical protein